MALPVLLRTDLWAFKWNWDFEPICSSDVICKRVIFFKLRLASHDGQYFFQMPFAILSFIDMCFHFLWHNTPHYEIHAACICLSCDTTCLSVLRRLMIFSVRCTHHLSAASLVNLLLYGSTPIKEGKEGVLVYQVKPPQLIKSDILVTRMDTTRTRNWQHFSHYFYRHYWREMSTLSW